MAKPVTGGDHIHVVFNFHGNPEVLLRGNKIEISILPPLKELDALPGLGPTMAKRIEGISLHKRAPLHLLKVSRG